MSIDYNSYSQNLHQTESSLWFDEVVPSNFIFSRMQYRPDKYSSNYQNF
jgi:hypothetical protein